MPHSIASITAGAAVAGPGLIGVRRSAFANLTGQLIVAVVQIVMIPVYVRYVGVEAYGLVGVYLSLLALAQLLDLGMSPAINRQMARFSVIRHHAAEARDFVRTSEAIYAGIGVTIGTVLLAGAPFVARHWLRQVTLPEADVINGLRLIAVLIAAQWPVTLYQGALLGLNRHVSLNAIRSASAVVSATGSVFVLARISPTIGAFFAWQAIVSLLQVASMAALVWRALPMEAARARVRWSAVQGSLRFAAGMSAVTVTAVVIYQMDRLVLSRTVSLEQFGFYALAGVVSAGLTTFANALFSTMFPMFSRLSAINDDVELRRQYITMWGVMTALVVPFAAVVATFRYEVFFVWTRNSQTAAIAAPLAAWLVVGAALNGFMVVV